MNLFPADYCLICHSEIEQEIGWVKLLLRTGKQVVCSECRGKLQLIEGERCLVCGRPFAGMDPLFIKEKQCLDCVRWEKSPEWKEVLRKNTSLYEYNAFMQEVMARYKYRGDYALAAVFADELRKVLGKEKPDYIVPIPLSEKRLCERGFNQTEALIKTAGYFPSSLLVRTHSEKQSKKTRNERIYLQQVFGLKEETGLLSKHILLIDDIYTTGSTLRHAAIILKQQGAESISSITIARG
ncbi:ComF family protein [Bacillus infantis]|uniref:ComF family protein n=1 Tax=Bacillus infantis TaxID=324767 RepID=UPI003CF0B19B